MSAEEPAAEHDGGTGQRLVKLKIACAILFVVWLSFDLWSKADMQERLGLVPGQPRSAHQIDVIEGLSEVKTGDFSEVETADELEALFVRAFDGAEAPGASFLTGETYAALWDRVAAAWQSLIARDDWTHAFVAAHGVVNRTILAQGLGAGPQIYRRLEQDAGCLNVLDIEGQGDAARTAYVRLVNFTPYNATKEGMQETTLEALWRRFVEG